MRSARLLFNHKHFHFIKRCLTASLNYEVAPLNVLGSQAQLYINSFERRSVHTAKGWKTLANPEAEILNQTACEEGTGAVPHEVLLSRLEKCDSVKEQIYALSSMLSLSPKDIENRKNFCQSFADLFSPYFPSFKMHLFGSSVNGIGFKGCDVDISIQVDQPTDVPGDIDILDVPALKDVLSGEVPLSTVSRLRPRFLLRFVRRILRQHCPDIKEPILLVSSRCPILRFYNAKFDLFCDFSCANSASLNNTKVLRLVGHMDNRVVPLLQTLRYWGKYGKFVGDVERFNSYAFSLLVLYFFQNTNPPVLPTLNEILSKADYLTFGDVGDEEIMFNDLKKFKPSSNDQSVDELLKEFFFFYSYFDFSRVMQPLTGSSVLKQDYRCDKDTGVFEFSTICVDDPFRKPYNTTFAVNHRYCKRFLSSLIAACRLYQDTSIWTPQSGIWGISSLFANVSEEQVISDISSRTFSFQIALDCNKEISNAAELVKKVLDYGFLIKCKTLRKLQTDVSFKTDNSLAQSENFKTIKHILGMNCEAVQNTWIDRNRILKENYSDVTVDDPIEREHMISLHLLQGKTNQKEPVFKFVCNCYELRNDEQTSLLVTFAFEPSKCLSIFTIFLKEHVPKLLQKVL